MEISKTRTLKVNMGNWEHVEEFHRATVSTEDLLNAGIDTEAMSLNAVAKILEEFVDRKLDQWADTFIKRCASISACEDSFALAWPLASDQPAEPPAKAKTTTKKTIRRPA
jgi:hypothetical protein